MNRSAPALITTLLAVAPRPAMPVAVGPRDPGPGMAAALAVD